MKDFWYRQFYGNTVGQWLIVLFMILGFLILSRIIYWLSVRFIKVFAKKSKTQLDDILIDKSEEPLVLLIVIYGIQLAIRNLVMDDHVHKVINAGIFLSYVMTSAWWVIRIMDSFSEIYIVPKVKASENDLDDAIFPLVRRGLKSIIWITAVIIGLDNAGYDITALIASLGIGGLAFALAARDTVTNTFGGITILINHPFKISDRVIVNKYDGFVEDIGLTRTTLRLFLTEEVLIIPNSYFITKELINISKARAFKESFTLNLSFENSYEKIEQAIQALKDMIHHREEVENDSKVAIDKFSEVAIVVMCVFYVRKPFDIWDTKTIIANLALKIMKDLEVKMITRTVKMIGTEAPKTKSTNTE